MINLSVNKDRVLQEAFRVLKPGGRFAVSDLVTKCGMLPEVRQSVLLWVGCVAGALEENEFRRKLAAVGFEKSDIEATRIYHVEETPRVSLRTRPGRKWHRSAGPSMFPALFSPSLPARQRPKRCLPGWFRRSKPRQDWWFCRTTKEIRSDDQA